MVGGRQRGGSAVVMPGRKGDEDSERVKRAAYIAGGDAVMPG